METIWREELSPFLAERESRRKVAVRELFIGTGGGIVGGVVGLIVLAGLGVPQFGFFALIGLGVLGGYLGGRKFTALRREVKVGLLNRLAEVSSMRYSLKPPVPARFDVFREHGLIPSSDRRSFEDHFIGERHGSVFELYEAKLEEKRHSDKRTYWVTVFRGLMIRIEFPRTVEGLTVITRDKGIFNAFEGWGRKTFGNKLKKVGLVDPKFENIFEVYSTDQVMSRYLLTPTFMERLIALENAVKGKKVRAAFDERQGGGELLIAVETGNLFEPGSLFKPLDDEGRVRTLLHEIEMVTGMLDLMVRPPELDEDVLADQSK
ncbi:DUF3137 domain-containing protein [Hyphobacterium sp. HN65]|uniref:DUF3137 domain-containing protein n=2 Tax=Hyphobacterium lacteum TaxID=3116575 RepID=A0ABU7LT71_9PROT|nr:DUF3137 domain-containing protein [Hyphobacterium sp. HN65]